MKDYKFTLTKDYVSSWGLWEAVREILQNAQDNPNGLWITYNSDTGTLRITNNNTKLNINTLVMGVGNKKDDDTKIGGFSEGSILALLVLLRLGKRITITNSDEVWVPSFKYDEDYNCELLTVSVGKGDVPTDCYQVEISRITLDEITMLKERSLVIAKELKGNIGKTLESEYGTILLDPKYAGKFYVEGLFIQDDSTFTRGYSFKNKYVTLDRDRRAINYYDLLELTTNSLLTQTEDLKLVETAIIKREKDIKSIDDFFTEIPQDFAVGYADYFLKKHDITEDTFVGTEKEVLLSDSESTFTTDSVQARIVNQGLHKDEEYKKIQNLAKNKDNVDLAWKYYKEHTLYKLHQWIKYTSPRLSNKQINKFLNIISNIKPSCFNLIQDDVMDNLISGIKLNKPKFKRSTIKESD